MFLMDSEKNSTSSTHSDGTELCTQQFSNGSHTDVVANGDAAAAVVGHDASDNNAPIEWYSKFSYVKVKHPSLKENEKFWGKQVMYKDKGHRIHVTKRYGVTTTSRVIKGLRSGELKHFYEEIQPEDAHQFHCDLDGKYAELVEKLSRPVCFQQCYDAMIQNIIPSVFGTADDLGIHIATRDYHQFNSCRDEKFSFHVHFPGLYFANRNIAAAFAHQVYLKIVKHDISTQIFDCKIYHYGMRAFRCPYSSKLLVVPKNKLPHNGSKVLWKGQRYVELDELLDEELWGLFVRSNPAGTAPITMFTGYNVGQVYGIPGSRKKRMVMPRSQSPNVVKRRKASSTINIRSGIRNIAEEYLNQHHSSCAKQLKFIQQYEMDDGKSSVHFAASDTSSGFTCPFGEIHKSNHLAVFVDPLLERAVMIHCFGGHGTKSIPRNCGVCTGCNKCHASAVIIDNINQSVLGVCSEMPYSSVQFSLNDIYYKYGGSTQVKQYHSRELLDEIAGRCLTAMRSDTGITIELSSSMGAGKTTGLMYVLRRIRQSYNTARILIHTSRCALASQLFNDSKSTSFLPTFGDGTQHLDHVSGNDLDMTVIDKDDELPALDMIHYKQCFDPLSTKPGLIYRENIEKISCC